MNKDTKDTILGIAVIFLIALSFLGWYTAEMDNQILRKQVEQYTGEAVRL